MSEYYDRQGNPITFKEWVEQFERTADKVVEQTQTDNGFVSTVWLGLSHQFGDGPPLIFETLVFEGTMDGEMDRYSTEEQARAGHAEMVARVKEATP